MRLSEVFDPSLDKVLDPDLLAYLREVASRGVDTKDEGSRETVRAKLPQQIAVFLLYWTAYVTPDGQVNFRDDPYGWDRELVQRIAALRPGSA